MVTISFTDDEALQVRKALSARAEQFETWWGGYGETPYRVQVEYQNTETAWNKVAGEIRKLGGT